MKSSINNNMSNKLEKVEPPPLIELENRFFNLNTYIKVEIDYRGYIPEIKGIAPFKGIVSVKNIINILNRDINVIIVNNEDILKLRNSIIYYNEYYIPNKDLNQFNCKSAPIAFTRIESLYLKRIGEQDKVEEIKNPFKNNLIKDFANTSYISNFDEEVDKYIRKKNKENLSIKSSRLKQDSNIVKEEVVPMFSVFNSNMPRTINLENYEYCFEDCNYIN